MRRISVIIVSWNAREYLRDCLNSIRKTCQDPNVDITVVDNASSDGSPEMVTLEFPGVRLISTEKNLGFARANNLAMKLAAGDYFALVNSDVVVHPGCLQGLTDFLEAHPKVGLAGPSIAGRDGRRQQTCRRLPTIWNTFCRALALDGIVKRRPFSDWITIYGNHIKPVEVEVLSGCFWVARREAVLDVGSLDERFFFYAEDLDWCKRFWNSGWKVVYVPDAIATHMGGGSSSNAPLKYSIELLRADLIYWKKHHGWLGQAFFYLLTVVHHVLRLVMRSLKHLFSEDAKSENDFRCMRSYICLRWLLTGREV